MLKTLFTEILSKDDWLKFMDDIFTRKEDPELLPIYVSAIILLSK